MCEYCAKLGDTRELRPERAAATFAWAAQDLARTGIMGDATAATVEKGERWIDHLATGLAESIAVLCTEGRARAAAKS